MLQSNLDVTDAALNTKAPFRWDCPLELGSETLPMGSFVGIKVYITEDMLPPVRIHRITTTAVEFYDAKGSYVGSIELPAYIGAATGFILNKNGIISGHFSCVPEALTILRQAAIDAGGVYHTKPKDFVLLPQCHAQSMEGCARAIQLGSTVHTTNSTLYAGQLTTVSVTEGTNTAAQISVHNTYKGNTTATNQLCHLLVNGITYWIGDQHISLLPGVQSNLRIEQDTSGFTFVGVTDV